MTSSWYERSYGAALDSLPPNFSGLFAPTEGIVHQKGPACLTFLFVKICYPLQASRIMVYACEDTSGFPRKLAKYLQVFKLPESMLHVILVFCFRGTLHKNRNGWLLHMIWTVSFKLRLSHSDLSVLSPSLSSLSFSLSLYIYIYIYLKRKQVIISIHNSKSHVPHFYISPRSYRDWIWNEFGNNYQGTFEQTQFLFLSALISRSEVIFPLSHRTHGLVCQKKIVWCLP